MADLMLPPSPHWYCSQSIDINSEGILVLAARHDVYVLDASTLPPTYKSTCGLHFERVTSVMLGCTKQTESLCVSGAEDGKVKLWNTADPREALFEHDNHVSKVACVAWSPLQPIVIVSGSDRGEIISWQYTENRLTSFTPENLPIISMRFSTQSEYLLAVGYKGVILILDVQRDGYIVHRLRGHDEDVQSLAWCPIPGENLKGHKEAYDDLDNPVNLPAQGSEADVADFGTEGQLLVSGSKDKTVRIWSTTTGRQLLSCKLPKATGLSGKELYAARMNVWTAVVWSKSSPLHIICSSYGGEIVRLDLSVSGNQKWQSLSSTDRKMAHTRLVFGLCIGGPGDNTLVSSSMDRQLIFWDVDKISPRCVLPTLGGFVYVTKTSSIDPGRLALGIGDGMIRVWNLNNPTNQFDVTTLWQGIRSKVTALCWHPQRESVLAYGTDDGRVGIYDTLGNKPPSISSHYHRRTVYVVAWGPPVSQNEGTAGSPYVLYSVGDGVVLLHDPQCLQEEATDVNTIIQSVNETKPKLPIRSEISWSPDFSLVAIGNDDGSVEIFRPPTMRLVCTVHIHHKLINCIQWHPHHTTSSPTVSLYKEYIATGSNESAIQIVDLTTVIGSPDDPPSEAVLITQPKISLLGHGHRITNLQWSPHVDTLLASVSYDGTARVWDVTTGQMIACYHGHRGRLLCVQWSGFECDMIFTGGEDFTLQKWKYTKHPPSAESKDMKKRKNKSRSRKKHMVVEARPEESNKETENVPSVSGPAGVQSVSGPGVVLPADERESLHNLLEEKKEELLLTQGEDDEVLTTGPDHPAGRLTSNKDQSILDGPENREQASDTAESPELVGKTVSKSRGDKSEYVKDGKKGKKWKTKSLFPLCGRRDNRSREGILEDIEKLAKIIFELQATEDGRVEDFWSVFDPEESISLGFFIKDRRAIFQCLELEGQYHRDHDNMDYYYQLEIWKGNINGALRLAREREELSDWLVAMAPMAAFDTWIMTCQDYANQLEGEGQYHKAATYLLAAHKVYDALELFKRHRLFKEAIALAKARLSPFDPVLEDLYMLWAHQLTKDGNYEQAAKCHLAMRQVKDAALLLARRYNCQSNLKTAARISLVASDKQQGMVYAHKIMQQHLIQSEWTEAYQFLQEQKVFQGLVAVAGMHELVTKELLSSNISHMPNVDQSKFTDWKSQSQSKVIIPDFILDMQDSDPISPWKPWLTEGHTFPHHVLRVWYSSLSVAMDTENIEDMYKSLSVLHAGKQTQEELSKLLLQVSVDLVLCLLSLLMSETPAAISHLLHAVSSLHEAGHVRVMEMVLRLFLPQGPKYILKLQQEITAMRVVISMESRSDFDGASKVHTIKRYMSELKEKDSVSCGGIRCRELDCLRAYYYLAILEYLRDRLRSESLATPKVNSEEKTESLGEVTHNAMSCDNDENQKDGSVAHSCVKDQDSSTVKPSENVAAESNIETETEGVNVSDQSARGDQSVTESAEKGDNGTLKENGDSSKREHVILKSEECSLKTDSMEVKNEDTSSLEGSSVDGDVIKQSKTESTQSVEGSGASNQNTDKSSEVLSEATASLTCGATVSVTDEKGEHGVHVSSTTEDSASCAYENKQEEEVNQTYELTLNKLSHLSRGLLWDIQGKRYALMETLGYIHKAISQLLLAQKPNSLSSAAAAQSDTVQSHSDAHDYTTQVSRDISSFSEVESSEVLQEHVHNHEQLEQILSHLSSHGCKKRHNSAPVPALSSANGGTLHHHHHHHHDDHAHSFSRSMSSETPSLDFHIHHEHVCPAHGNHDPTNENPLDLCTSCEWLSKSRKVLWEDEPANQLVAENSGKGKLMSIVSPAKYINTPDEWYNMSADQKYSKPYVTMAILKEEQEYMMSELKRGPDSIQAPFPNPIDSVKLLLDVCHTCSSLTATDKKQFTERAVTWALRFSVSTQQKDLLLDLRHKMLPR